MLGGSLSRRDYPEADMGTIKCKNCSGTWTVSTARAETIIVHNHIYLYPGHRTITQWDEPVEYVKAS